jgi:Ran GTPase-activating protein (RanGAP) involved in mRNA processing and transport
MRHNTSLTHLDLSRNLIGKQESINYVNPEFYTGAEALADWLASPQCKLRYLDLSWNTIRLDSAIQFGNCLAKNASLTTLLLGYNGFGATGGEAIGAALCSNRSLLRIDLEANSISPRAAVVIAEGMIANQTLKDVSLGHNSLGKQGAVWVTRLPGEMKGRAKIDVKGSNFQIEDSQCWFSDDKVSTQHVCIVEFICN